jgi:hypothetical protein
MRKSIRIIMAIGLIINEEVIFLMRMFIYPINLIVQT